MASEARMAANRLNAQKSTGPRTAAGKAVVAQNAVKHGLLAREAVLRGEDREEYEMHREALLEELKPTGTLEVMLAARIVNLTWRLYRAAQNQDETFGALYDRYTAGTPEPAGAAERGAILGRMILEDYSGGAVLERLLRCERRIESSLFRNLNELRRVHDQSRKADAEAAGTLARWRDEDDQAWKARRFSPGVLRRAPRRVLRVFQLQTLHVQLRPSRNRAKQTQLASATDLCPGGNRCAKPRLALMKSGGDARATKKRLAASLRVRRQINCAKQDAHDKSRGGMGFAISRYYVWIYDSFCVDKSGREIIL